MHALSAFPKNVHSMHPECYHKKSVVKCVERKIWRTFPLLLALKNTWKHFFFARFMIRQGHFSSTSTSLQNCGKSCKSSISEEGEKKHSWGRKRETFHSKNVHAGIWKLLNFFFEGFPLSVSQTREKLSKDFLFVSVYGSWRMWATCLLFNAHSYNMG